MSNVRITTDDRHLKAAIHGFEQHLHGTRSVMIVIGRELRDYVKDTIRLGGRSEGPWAPLSPWTVARTGRTKPLQGVQKFIRYNADKNVATVYAADTGEDWTVQQHHEGYYTPERSAINTVMRVPAGRGARYFKHAAASKVPARQIWPNVQAVEFIARRAVEDWVAQGARKVWR